MIHGMVYNIVVQIDLARTRPLPFLYVHLQFYFFSNIIRKCTDVGDGRAVMKFS
jgi:hypothetical protein